MEFAKQMASIIPVTGPPADSSAQEVLATLPPPPPPPVFKELSAAEKLAKEQRENPTVDENGEHI